jgi:hypothetical protein
MRVWSMALGTNNNHNNSILHFNTRTQQLQETITESAQQDKEQKTEEKQMKT